MTWHRPASDTGGPGSIVDIGPSDAGWEMTGLRVLRLAPGITTDVRTGESEVFVLPLAGGLTVRITDRQGEELATFELSGRTSVFARVTDFCYAGRDSALHLTSADGAEVAIPSSRCDQTLPPAYGAAEDVPVEVRGAGPATRQVTNFGVPGVWDHAENLICCELVTPDGNWSSYPPHKHDATEPCQVVNEEIYYYRIAGRGGIEPSREGFGYHTTYTGPEHRAKGLDVIDMTAEVRDHDVVLVPHGYHGPCVAAPGYPMYYLNVMAGPGEGRAMAFCDDPAHGWLRSSWDGLATDPRCPLTSAAGREDQR